MATALDIHVDQGSDVRVPIAFIDDFSELDLTGYTARMELRLSASSKRVVDRLTTENGRISIEKGTLTLFWSHEITESLSAGRYVYDLELVSAGGEGSYVVTGATGLPADFTADPVFVTVTKACLLYTSPSPRD